MKVNSVKSYPMLLALVLIGSGVLPLNSAFATDVVAELSVVSKLSLSKSEEPAFDATELQAIQPLRKIDPKVRSWFYKVLTSHKTGREYQDRSLLKYLAPVSPGKIHMSMLQCADLLLELARPGVYITRTQYQIDDDLLGSLEAASGFTIPPKDSKFYGWSFGKTLTDYVGLALMLREKLDPKFHLKDSDYQPEELLQSWKADWSSLSRIEETDSSLDP